MNAPQPDVPSVPMQPVTSSSNVSAWGYDIPNRMLYVEFKGGATYRYRDVPNDVAVAFADAESKGSYFLKEIKPKFLDFIKLAPKPEPEAAKDTSREDTTRAPATDTARVPWPFPAGNP